MGSAAIGIWMEFRGTRSGRLNHQTNRQALVGAPGRVDNKADLVRQTGNPKDCGASEIALDLYKRNGLDGLRALIGDWSLCIWDASQRMVVLASDFAGIRPIYYHLKGPHLFWSSNLTDVVSWTESTQIDDLYVGRFLRRGSGGDRTPYAGVFAVRPGHAVRVSAAGLRIEPFWTLPLHQETRYDDERTYEEELSALFREAVAVRIESADVVFAELSGGLDSSSVVCMADRLRKESQGYRPDLRTFSYTHENCPDEPFFNEVERFCGIEGAHLELNQCAAADADPAGSTPAWWEPRLQELARRMSSGRSRVFLTGQLGDLIMGNKVDDTEQVAEWMAKGEFRKAGQEAYSWARSLGVPIYPILWRSIRQSYSSWVPPVDPREAVGAIRGSMEDSLTDVLRAQLDDDERQTLAQGPWRDAPAGQRGRMRTIYEVLQSRNLQTPEAFQNISYGHPFAHRPLVEFMLTIPAGIICAPGEPRRLMRRAFGNLLPAKVLNRKSKAVFAAIYRESMLPLAHGLLKNPGGIYLIEHGHMNGRSLIERLEKFTRGLDCNEHQLLQAILLEFWLRKPANSLPTPPSLQIDPMYTPSALN